jgi:SAM-dependent methyltransferase
VYGAEDVHDFARRAIRDVLALGPSDHLVEPGCGGGLLLRDALASGANATGLDHSEEMVELARERAPGAEIVLGRADSPPFPDDSFSAVAMSLVFLFLDDPLARRRPAAERPAPSSGDRSTPTPWMAHRSAWMLHLDIADGSPIASVAPSLIAGICKWSLRTLMHRVSVPRGLTTGSCPRHEQAGSI